MKTKKKQSQPTNKKAIEFTAMLADCGSNQAANSNSSTEGKNSKKRFDLNKVNYGNKLIAEFMGAEPDEEYPTLYFIEPHLNDNVTHDFYIGRYHLSWEWLMPVIEKISKIRYEGEIDKDEVYCYAYFRTFFYQPQTDGTLMAMVRINRMGLHTAATLIEAAWNAIVDFIETDLK